MGILWLTARGAKVNDNYNIYPVNTLLSLLISETIRAKYPFMMRKFSLGDFCILCFCFAFPE